LSTKVGRRLVPETGDVEGAEGFYGTPKLARVRDYSRDGALATLEASLRRLDTDRIDIALIHDPDDYAAEALDGAYTALDQLRSEGTIRAVGVGMNLWGSNTGHKWLTCGFACGSGLAAGSIAGL
jgi:D-threo-aldose 1-dehydrogenase